MNRSLLFQKCKQAGVKRNRFSTIIYFLLILYSSEPRMSTFSFVDLFIFCYDICEEVTRHDNNQKTGRAKGHHFR